MLVLDSTLMVLQAVMGSATGTTEPVAHVVAHIIQSETKTGFEEYQRRLERTVLTGATNVTISAAPGSNQSKAIDHLAIVNRSTDTETITISTYDGTNRYPIIGPVSLTTGQTLWYENGHGWGIN